MIGGQRQRAPRSFGSLPGWEDARVASRMAVTDIPPALRGPHPTGFPDSAWQLLVKSRKPQLYGRLSHLGALAENS